MTIEERVDKLEEKFEKLEKDLNNTLGDIKQDLIEIKSCVKGNNENGDLKNELIKTSINDNSKRIEKLEGIVSKITWTLVLAVLGVIGEAVYYFIQNGG